MRRGVELAVDINQDGFVDILKGASPYEYVSTKKYLGRPVELLLGTANGRFVPAPAGAMPTIPLIPTSFASGDLDGDGDVDVVITRIHSAGKLTGLGTMLFLNNGKGSFIDATSRLPDIGDPARDVACFDADGDGDLDLLIARGARYTSSSVMKPYRRRLFLNDGKARFKEAPSLQFPGVVDNTISLATADIDLDGDIDVIVGNQYLPTGASTGIPGQNRVFLNNGKGTFKEKVGGLPADKLGTTQVIIADFNGDKNPDLFSAGSTKGDRLYLGNGRGSFTATTGVQQILGTIIGATAGDIDDDGDPDVIVSRWMNPRDKYGEHYLLRNDGKGGLRWIQDGLPIELRIVGGIDAARLIDADGDGDPDLFALNQVFENRYRQLSFAACPRTGYPLEVKIESSPGRNPSPKVAALFFQVGAAGRSVSIPPFGRFGLDLLRAQLLSVMTIPAPAGAAVFSMPIPNDRRLQGIPLGMQALIAEGTKIKDWRFTNMVNEQFR